MELVVDLKGKITMVTTLESGYALTRGAICIERREIVIQCR
jgi:hypothetical protein